MQTESNTPQEENAIRAVLRNELTWVASIIVAVWGVIVYIILPIQALQLGQSNINLQIAQIQSSQADIPSILQDHAVMKQEITEIQSELQTHIAQTK